MKVSVLGRVDPFDNQDELAVAHALRSLGHEVVCVQEQRRKRTHHLESVRADACLFFKHPVVSEIIDLAKRMPCLYWHFDYIDGTCDPTLAARSLHRIQWVNDVLPHVVAGFHTDGTWVQNARFRSDAAGLHSGKLVHLCQGADERVAGFGRPGSVPFAPEVLFTGMVHHGQRRAAHVAHLRERWGSRFGVVGDSGPRGRVHGRDLADLFASAKVVVAPDGPQTANYTSNRLVLSLSLGAFLLHPYCDLAARMYREGEEVVFYRSWDECDELIERYLADEDGRQRMRLAGHRATMERHTYRHRVSDLMAEVERRL